MVSSVNFNVFVFKVFVFVIRDVHSEFTSI